MTPRPGIVETAFGGLLVKDARAVVRLLPDPGFAAFRDLLAARHKQLLVEILSPTLPPDRALFARGALSVIQGIHEVLLALPTDYATVLEQEGLTHVSENARGARSPGDPGIERGPE